MLKKEKVDELFRSFDGKSVDTCISIIKHDKSLSAKDKISVAVELGLALGIRKGKEMAYQEAKERYEHDVATTVQETPSNDVQETSSNDVKPDPEDAK